MVKRYYVITTGVEVGVFFDHWTNIAPLVKNKPGAVWQGSASQEEAQELFQQASVKGNVRVLPSDQQRSPATSSGSRTSSAQRSSSGPHSTTSNPQPLRQTSAPRIVGSQSEGHVWNNASHYVPARSNSREMNTGYGASNGNSGSSGMNRSKPLSRTYSEPGQQVHNSSSVRRGYSSSGGSAPVSGASISTRTSVSPLTPQNTGIRIAIVESPPWLASYPDEEDDAFITPPLSPIISPAISSRLLGPNKSEPASTFAPGLSVAADMTGKLASDDGSGDVLNFRSPKLAKPTVSISFSPRPQLERPGARAGEVFDSGGRTQRQRELQDPGVPSPVASCRNLGASQHPSVVSESFIDLVDKVGKLVEDLRIQVVSPSARTDDGHLRGDEIQNYFDSKRCFSPNLPSGGRNEFTDITSPRAQGPDHSILFSQGSSSPAHKGIYSPISLSACKHCKGTGYNVEEDTSFLNRTGLSQPTLAPLHAHDDAQDPRSPFNSSKMFSPIFGRPSPTISLNKLSSRTSPLIVSPPKRG
ncbi:hypothetical protein D9756_005316 [Leucocoprinus leucothites]|uniref:Ribonuclease H1 N-terminal domain-containing protein n=1 Tax=Leucocoprinus leucothites TaxID=201217 RepID=A0A8H5FZP1_9AGAR|nr:hypothetical protein D9756_005316 [Leucoagaricus leucothites]